MNVVERQKNADFGLVADSAVAQSSDEKNLIFWRGLYEIGLSLGGYSVVEVKESASGDRLTLTLERITDGSQRSL